MGEIYRVTDDNRLGRRLQRQVAQMEAEAEEADWIEEQLDAPLPPEIAQSLQEDHENAVALAKAQAAADARRSDEAADAAAAAMEPVKMYVRRGSRHYAPVGSAKLKPGEPVHVRQAGGKLKYVGETTGDAIPELPDLPIQL